MRRFIGVCCFLGVLFLGSATAHAAGNGSQPSRPTDWDRHDTAVYVVSTINLLHTKSGQAIATLLSDKYDVARYAVYADTGQEDLYFIQLRRSDSKVLGTFVYKMGWQMPLSLSSFTDRLGVHHASSRYYQEYRNDPKVLMDTFTSTLPQ